MDPIALIGILMVLVLAGTDVVLAAVFVQAWRRGSAPAPTPPATFFDLLPRRLVLFATGAGLVASVVILGGWKLVFLG